MPDKWHRYYFENNTTFLLPTHSKTIEVIEGFYIDESNAIHKQGKEERKIRQGAKKGDFIPRKVGERYQDDKGNNWQVIF